MNGLDTLPVEEWTGVLKSIAIPPGNLGQRLEIEHAFIPSGMRLSAAGSLLARTNFPKPPGVKKNSMQAGPPDRIAVRHAPQRSRHGCSANP